MLSKDIRWMIKLSVIFIATFIVGFAFAGKAEASPTTITPAVQLAGKALRTQPAQDCYYEAGTMGLIGGMMGGMGGISSPPTMPLTATVGATGGAMGGCFKSLADDIYYR